MPINTQNGFRLFIIALASIIVFLSSYNIYIYLNLPTDENVFIDPPSKICTFDQIPAFKDEADPQANDLISEGSLIISIEGREVKRIEDIEQILSRFKNEKVKIEFYDRKLLLSRFSYAYSKDVLSANVKQLRSAILVIFIKRGGASERAGIQSGDLIIEINGRKFNSAIEADSYLIRQEERTKTVYTILRGAETIQKEVQLTTIGINATIVFRLFIGLCYLCFGVFLGIKRFEYFPARLLSIFFVLTSFFIFHISVRLFFEDIFISILTFEFINFSNAFAFAFLLHFLFYFPLEQINLLKKKSLLIINYSIGVVIFIISNYVFFTKNFELLGQISNFSVLPFLLYRIIISVIFRKRIIKDPNKILQKLGVIYLLLLALIIFTNFIFIKIFNQEELFSYAEINLYFLNLLLLSVPVAFFYFFSKYHYYDIKFRIRRNIAYTISRAISDLGFVVLLLFFFVILSKLTIKFPNVHLKGTTIEILSRPLPVERNIQYEKVAIGLLTISFVYLLFVGKKKLNAFLVKKFYRTKFDYRKTAMEFSELIIRTITIEDIASNVLVELKNIQFVKSAFIVIFRGERQIPLVEFFEIPKDLQSEILKSNFQGIVEIIQQSEEPVSINLLPAEYKQIFLQAGIEYIVPIIYKKRLEGFLALGEKLSESFYTNEDFEFISIVSKNIAIAINNARMYEELARRERIRQELEIARRIQLASLPKETPKTEFFDIYAISVPAYEVGGDFYDFFIKNERELTVIIGDVSGKGTSAALYVSKIQGIFQSLEEFDLPPLNFVQKANELLIRSIDKKFFISCFFAKFSSTERIATLIRAGHLGLIYFSRQKNEITKILPRGIVLGLARGKQFVEMFEEMKIEYKPNDIFVFISDGVVEPDTMTEPEVIENKICDTILTNFELSAKDLTEKIIDNIGGLNTKTELHDDFTILIVKPR